MLRLGLCMRGCCEGQREPLTGLMGELMGMIVLPYLGPAAARREQARPAPAAPAARPHALRRCTALSSARAVADPLESVPMRFTYRTSRVWRVWLRIRLRATVRLGNTRISRTRGRYRSCCGAWRAWGCWRTAARGI